MKLGINQLFKYLFSSIGVAILFPSQQFNYDCIPKKAPSSTGKKKQANEDSESKQTSKYMLNLFQISAYAYILFLGDELVGTLTSRLK